MRFLALFLCSITCSSKEWFIFFVFQSGSLERFQHFIGRCILCGQLAKNGIQKRLCHIIGISVCRLYFTVGFFRIHTESHVGRKSPWCCGPCQEIRIFSDYFKTYHCRTLFYRFVALCHLVGGQRRSTSRTIRYDLKSFIKQAFIPDCLECPPFGFNIIIMVSYIRIIHICPETNGTGEIFPHTFVFPYGFFTFADERIQTIFFNLFFSVQTK